jgi:hypothetical protein
MTIWSHVVEGMRRFPVVPGMLTYSLLYPGANLLQQQFFR